jgi:hypothetical protein
MKALTWIAWILIAAAAVILLLAAIAILSAAETFLGFRDIVNFFHAANSLLLMAVALLIMTKKCECNK